ncbi:hypothetical protein PM030_04520 [Halorubrum ezzemoulense]|uniref:hypothetical protein n=1 Tax=Halorubrum ezzemoulense TaxID=337243 RepID=UPI00232B8B69|nr:hypothetical protein [Halorubrum ezzemoulense]MDB2281132.1 hypothetical protein [Halorubrum ezzemoulense]
MSTTTPARLEHSGNDDESTAETDDTDECACSELREGFPCADCYINGDADVTPISEVNL